MGSGTKFVKIVLTTPAAALALWMIFTFSSTTLKDRPRNMRPYTESQNHNESQNSKQRIDIGIQNQMRSRGGSQSPSDRTPSAAGTFNNHNYPVQPAIGPGDVHEVVIVRRGNGDRNEYPKLCECDSDQFYVTNDTAALREADVLVFSVGMKRAMTEREWRERHRERRPSHLWILASRESPQSCTAVKPPEDMVHVYNLSFTYHSRSNFPTPYGRFIKFPSLQNVSVNWYAEKSKLIQWTSSHCDLAGRRYRRKEFVYALKDYLNITMYGKCGDGKVYGDEYTDAVRAHKFALVMENSCCSEYITEKLWNALTIYYNVPVVYGATREEYERIAPPNSFIFIQDFSSLQELAHYIIEVGSDEMKYNQYHDWRRLGYAQKQNLYNDRIYHCHSICRLSSTIKEARKGKIFQFDEKSDVFYGGCRKCQDEINVLLS